MLAAVEHEMLKSRARGYKPYTKSEISCSPEAEFSCSTEVMKRSVRNDAVLHIHKRPK